MKINRAPVLTLWAKIVALRLGFSEDEALALGKAVAGYTAQLKGRTLGIYVPKNGVKDQDEEEQVEVVLIELLGRQIPTIAESDGIRVITKGKLIDPASVDRYIHNKFGENLEEVTDALEELAKSYTPDVLNTKAFRLYEKFRPEIPKGKKGWGAKGELDLNKIKELRNR